MKIKRIVFNRIVSDIDTPNEGGAGTPVADLSIDMDDIDTALDQVKKAPVPIEYSPTAAPWGVRRFGFREPFAKPTPIVRHT